jgi:hypothetical protein
LHLESVYATIHMRGFSYDAAPSTDNQAASKGQRGMRASLSCLVSLAKAVSQRAWPRSHQPSLGPKYKALAKSVT